LAAEHEQMNGVGHGGQAANGPWHIARGRVAVTFVQEGDRWGHVVAVDGLVVARSVEGPWQPGGDDRWPASPVITEILEVTTASGPALAGVGRVGRSHVSLCVAADPRQPDTLLVEIACRIHDGPGWLGSTYRLATAGPESRGTGAVLRIAAPVEPAAGLPRTVCWTYTIDPTGIGAAAAEAGETPSPPA
jgi:hypothetical protein